MCVSNRTALVKPKIENRRRLTPQKERAMPNILFLTATWNNTKEFLDRVERHIIASGKPYMRFERDGIITTNNATLYVKSMNDNMFGALPRIDYYASGIDLPFLTGVRYDIFKNCISIKFSENVLMLSEAEVMGFLIGEIT